MSNMKTDVVERLGSIGNQVTLTTGATSAVIGWWTTEHVLSLMGVIFAAISLLVTWYYKRVAAERLAAEAVRRAEIHALDVEARQLQLEEQRGRIEEQRARIQLLRSDHCVAPAVNQALDELDTGLGKLEADLGKMSAATANPEGDPVKMEADE